MHDSATEQGIVAGYEDGESAPLAGYGLLIAAFNAIFAAFLLLLRLRNDRAPRLGVGDVVLLGVATHKLSRLGTKDFVTSPLRAPFTHVEASGGAGEMNEQGRGSGLRLAIGQLLTCPWCFDWWVAALLGYGLALAPRLTRFVIGIFSAVAVADYLQFAYEKAKSASGQAPSS